MRDKATVSNNCTDTIGIVFRFSGPSHDIPILTLQSSFSSSLYTIYTAVVI